MQTNASQNLQCLTQQSNKCTLHALCMYLIDSFLIEQQE